MAMASTPPACAASELVAKGRESAAVLQAMLGQQPHGLRDLTEQILRCCDRALAALRSSAEDEAAGGSARKRKPERHPAAAPEASSKRMRASRGEKGTRIEKKRTTEDGFIWRKYGQKDIQGSKHPRLYFRCTYKDDNGCSARRQVQRSEADPSVYLVTYFGEHTCCRDDGDQIQTPAPFVINFGSSTWDGPPTGSPWPSCDEDGPVAGATSSDLCNSPEDKELLPGMGNVAELNERSTPAAPELTTTMRSAGWDPLDGCLDWELGDWESTFDIGDFISLDYLACFNRKNA